MQAKQPEPEVLDLASSGEDASTSQAASRLQVCYRGHLTVRCGFKLCLSS